MDLSKGFELINLATIIIFSIKNFYEKIKNRFGAVLKVAVSQIALKKHDVK